MFLLSGKDTADHHALLPYKILGGYKETLPIVKSIAATTVVESNFYGSGQETSAKINGSYLRDFLILQLTLAYHCASCDIVNLST